MYNMQKRPTTEAKEIYYRGKRDLLPGSSACTTCPAGAFSAKGSMRQVRQFVTEFVTVSA
jgi:hypothetical protein